MKSGRSAVANTPLFGHQVCGLVGVVAPSTESAKSDILGRRVYGEFALHECTISRTSTLTVNVSFDISP